jgi:hypothetical protein
LLFDWRRQLREGTMLGVSHTSTESPGGEVCAGASDRGGFADANGIGQLVTAPVFAREAQAQTRT